MVTVEPFSDEQSRVCVNLAQQYAVWMEAQRGLAAMPYDLRIKDVTGRRYLYEITGRDGNGTSLGPLTSEAAQRFDDYRAMKATLKARVEQSGTALAQSCRLYRALRLPLLSSDAGAVAREADRRGLLGTSLIVVGTNAVPAYALEANGFVRELPDETLDFDMAWVAETKAPEPMLWPMLKAVDATYAVNTERSFQARNAKAYEVEVLVAPSRSYSIDAKDRPRAVPLPEQEWLLLGRPVDHVVVCRDGSATRIVAPDPRWFALLKLWLADQDKRTPLKRRKDRLQGQLLLDAVAEQMPHYPLDAAFEVELPDELRPVFAVWRDAR
jgi:hypothetical protein